nr:hypothetical protein [uncultured Acetatifactor sp.]
MKIKKKRNQDASVYISEKKSIFNSIRDWKEKRSSENEFGMIQKEGA